MEWHARRAIRLLFKTEDIQNEGLLELIKDVRAEGTPCYLATEQEFHRGEYMKNVMFKDLFDGHFITAEIGYKKSNPDFFRAIISSLTIEIDNLTAENIVFFDDSQSKVDAALKAGITAHLFTSTDQVREILT